MASQELEKDDKRQDKKRNILVIIIVLLVLLNGFFAFNHFRTQRKIQHTESKRNELDSLYKLAIYDIEQAKEKLNLMKGKNAELDKKLIEKEKLLIEKQDYITALLNKNELSAIEILKARNLVNTLREDSNKYIEELAKLNKEMLLLKYEKDSLTEAVNNKISENEILLEDKNMLDAKVALASLLKPFNITGIGVRYRSGNQITETNVAKKTEKLKVCFDIPENKIAETGQKEIYVKIISPNGSTIAIESNGSGVFTEAETGEPIQYTIAAAFDYEQAQKNVCVFWQQNTNYTKGVYRIKLYQKNTFLSEGSFELR